MELEALGFSFGLLIEASLASRTEAFRIEDHLCIYKQVFYYDNFCFTIICRLYFLMVALLILKINHEVQLFDIFVFVHHERDGL